MSRSCKVSFVSTLSVLCTSMVAYGDAAVWTNGIGFGGASVTVKGANGVTTTKSVSGFNTNTPQTVTSADGTASVTFSWGPLWSTSISGTVCPGASYGGGSVAGTCVGSDTDLDAAFEPAGASGSQLRVSGTLAATGVADAAGAIVHYAVLGVNPAVIPEGFLGDANDLVEESVITSADILFQFSGSDPLNLVVDQLVNLQQTRGEEDVTLLAFAHGQNDIPAVSTWGLAVMLLLVLSAGTVVIVRKRTAVAG